MNFLLAEDYEFNALLVKEKLRSAGDNCTVVVNGQEAVDMLTTRTDFDAVLMDLEMPVLDGREATIIIRNELQNKNKNIPIIAVTGYELDEVKSEQKKYGFDYILLKPIDMAELEKIKLNIKQTTQDKQ